jgi:hypothetical protein
MFPTFLGSGAVIFQPRLLGDVVMVVISTASRCQRLVQLAGDPSSPTKLTAESRIANRSL